MMTGMAQVTGKGHFRLFYTMTTFIWMEKIMKSICRSVRLSCQSTSASIKW